MVKKHKYREMVKIFKDQLTNPSLRNSIKKRAKEYYPDKFKESDFPARNLINIVDGIIIPRGKQNYEEMKYLFMCARSGSMRGYYKKKAQKTFSKEFKESDFPRKEMTRTSYKELVHLYNKSTDANYRKRIKIKTKRYYPSTFMELDFPSRVKKRPYMDYVREFNQTKDGVRRNNLKRRAKSKFPRNFKNSHFPRLKSGRKQTNPNKSANKKQTNRSEQETKQVPNKEPKPRQFCDEFRKYEVRKIVSDLIDYGIPFEYCPERKILVIHLGSVRV